MSSKTEDDHRYLYEREWRIVSGLQRKGPDGSELPSGFRKLSEIEKAELVAVNPRWGGPLRSTDSRITNQLSGTPMIDDFWLFDGHSHPMPDRVNHRLMAQASCPCDGCARSPRCAAEQLACTAFARGESEIWWRVVPRTDATRERYRRAFAGL